MHRAGQPRQQPAQPEFDFEHELPAGMDFFRVDRLAALWGCSVQHVFNLVESEELPVAVDLRAKASSRACIRVTSPRAGGPRIVSGFFP